MAGTTHSLGPLCMHEREQKQRKRNSACKGNLYSSSLCNYFIFMSMQIQFIKQFFKFYIQIIQASFFLPHLILNYSKGLNVAMLANQLISLKCFVGARFTKNGLKYTKKVTIMSEKPDGKIDLFLFLQISLPFCKNLPSSRYQRSPCHNCHGVYRKQECWRCLDYRVTNSFLHGGALIIRRASMLHDGFLLINDAPPCGKKMVPL